MEIGKKTQEELKNIENEKYNKWNTKINDHAKEIIELLREKQLSIRDFNEVVKVVNQVVGGAISNLNINYVLNNKPDVEKKEEVKK